MEIEEEQNTTKKKSNKKKGFQDISEYSNFEIVDKNDPIGLDEEIEAHEISDEENENKNKNKKNNTINPKINNNNINQNFNNTSNNANSVNIIIRNCLDSAKDQVIKNWDSKDKAIESTKPEKKNENEIQKEDSLYKAVEDWLKKLENEAENDLAEPIRSFKNGQRKYN